MGKMTKAVIQLSRKEVRKAQNNSNMKWKCLFHGPSNFSDFL